MPDVIDLSLASSAAAVEPGESTELEIRLRNVSSDHDTAAIEVEFQEASWVAIPVSAIPLAPGQAKSVVILFKPPRAGATAAGTYPFVVRARSIETGASSEAQGTLRVHPYHSLDVNLSPLRAESHPYASNARYDLAVQNLGNSLESCRLTASDPANECVYHMAVDHIDVGPGETVQVPLFARPRRKPVIGRSSTYGFQVKIESGARQPESAHGQLEYRAVCSPLVLIVLLALVSFAGYKAYQYSQPPRIHGFTANPEQIVSGQPVQLTYEISNVQKLTLIDDTINQSYKLDPTQPYRMVTPPETTKYTLVAEDSAGQQAKKDVTVVVTPVKAPPPPTISEFDAKPSPVEWGHGAILTWRVLNAASLVLAPLGKTIDLALPSLELPASELTETKTFTLVAKNSTGVASKSITLKVIPPPNPTAPEIISFAATPDTVRQGQPLTLAWNVSGASSIVIAGIGAVASQDSRTFQVDHSTSFTLSATAPSGAKSEKEVKVHVAEPAHIVSFKAAPEIITEGQSAQLVWDVQGADTVSIDGIGAVPPQGSHDVTPDHTTIYTLHAVDKTGKSIDSTATVSIGPPP